MNAAERWKHRFTDVPDPLGVGWDDPAYEGTIILFSYRLRIFWAELVMPIMRTAGWLVERLPRAQSD